MGMKCTRFLEKKIHPKYDTLRYLENAYQSKPNSSLVVKVKMLNKMLLYTQDVRVKAQRTITAYRV